MDPSLVPRIAWIAAFWAVSALSRVLSESLKHFSRFRAKELLRDDQAMQRAANVEDDALMLFGAETIAGMADIVIVASLIWWGLKDKDPLSFQTLAILSVIGFFVAVVGARLLWLPLARERAEQIVVPFLLSLQAM